MRFDIAWHTRKTARFAILAASCLTLVACSALLGLTDPALDVTVGDAGVGGGDGAPSGDGSGGDNDAGASDASPVCSSTDDLTSDDHNCGVCGHDCLGTKCTKSVCAPTLVVDNATLLAPYDLSIMGGFIYFTNLNSSGLAALAKVDVTAVNSAPPASVLVDWTTVDFGFPYQIATTGGNVYFASYSSGGTNGVAGGAIEKCTTTACPTTPPVLGIDAFAVATDGTNVVYAGNIYDDAGADTYRVIKSSLALGAPTQLVDDIGGSINYLQIADEKVYIASSTGVWVCPIGGCSGQAIPLTAQAAEEISIANGRIYFSSDPDLSAPSVQWVAISGGALTQVSGTVSNPLSVLADSKYVYIADIGDTDVPTDGKVMRCPLDGCGVGDSDAVILSTGASAGGNPRGLVEDDKYLYWGERTGKIWKIAK